MFDSVTYLERAIHLPDRETLVLADVHVGRDATSAVELPMGEADDLVDRLAALLGGTSADRVVVAGDFLHAFDSIPYGVHETVDRFVATVSDADAALSVVAGNHDTILGEFTDIETRSTLELGPETVVHHGHEIPDTTADRYIIGHEHPAIVVEGDRHPCFLECRNQLDGAAVLVLPAFNRFSVGTVVNDMDAADSMSPLLVDMDGCRPVLRTNEETLSFPGLGTLRSHL